MALSELFFEQKLHFQALRSIEVHGGRRSPKSDRLLLALHE